MGSNLNNIVYFIIGSFFVWIGLKNYPISSWIEFVFAIGGAIIILYGAVTLDFHNLKPSQKTGKSEEEKE